MNFHVRHFQTKLQLDGVSASKGEKSPPDAKLTPKMKEIGLFRKQLLLYLNEGMYPGQIIKRHKLDKNKVYRNIRIMKKAGIIFLESRARPHFYKVSPNILVKLRQQTQLDQFPTARDQVLKSLIGYDRLLEINTHHIKIRLDVTKGQLPIPAKSDKQYEMKGKWLRCIKHIRVKGLNICVILNHTSTPNMIVQVPQIYGSSLVENHARAWQIAEDVRNQFMRNTAFLELSDPYLAGKAHINIEDPILDYLSDKEQVKVAVDTPNGKVFACKTPVGGREFDSQLAVQDYVQMPQYVQKLTKEFYELKAELKKQQTTSQFEGRISDLEKGVNKLMDLVEKMMMYSQGQQQFTTTSPQNNPPGEMFG